MKPSHTKNSSPTIWDKKAKQYARFSHDPNTFAQKILAKIAHRGISFYHKTILDIGCGTGVYTLHIASSAHSVCALDFSQEMLDILHSDAQTENLLSKFSFVCSTWSDFTYDTIFDIIFSSMSPAFKSDADFEKMNALAREYCIYLGWGGKRVSPLLDEVFKAHGLTPKAPPGSDNLKIWLDKKNIAYTKEYIEDEWTTVKSQQEAIDSMLWHLEINEKEADEALVKKIVASHCDLEGKVAVHVSVGLELISWAK